MITNTNPRFFQDGAGRWRYRDTATTSKSAEIRKCESCGDDFIAVSHKKTRYCSRSCGLRSGRVGENHPSWKGGRHVDSEGYVRVIAKDHPSKLRYVPEHRLLMEKKLGRYLSKDETVHHINLDKKDNHIENLQLRNGRHGKGAVSQCADCESDNIIIICADCGSTNTRHKKLAECIKITPQTGSVIVRGYAPTITVLDEKGRILSVDGVKFN